MKTHGVKRELASPVFVHLKRHPCPDCGTVLKPVKVSETVNSKSPEAKDHDFSNGDTFLTGNVKFIRTGFACPGCGKHYSVAEIRDRERSRK